MRNYAIYETASGEVLRTVSCPEFLIDRQFDASTERCLEIPVGVEASLSRVVQGQFVPKEGM